MAALPSRGSSKAGPTPTNTQPANALLFPVDEDLLTRIRSLFLSRNGDRTPKTPNSSPQGTFQGISVPAKTFSPTRQSKIIQVQDLQKDPEATDQDKNSAHSRPRSPGYTAAQATRRVSTAYGVKNSPSSTGYQSPINARTEGQPYPRKSSLTWSGSRQPSITSPIVGVSNKVSRQGSKSTIYSKGRADEASVAVFPAVERKAVVKEAEAEAVLPSIPSTVFLPSPKVPDIPVEHGSSIPEPGKPHQERMGNLRAEFQDAKQDEETIVARDGIPDKIKSSLFPPRAASVHSGKSVETVRSDHSSVFKPSSSALEAASPIPPVFAAEWSAIKPCIPGPPVLKSLKPQKERASSAQTHTARGMQDRVPQDGQSILVEGQGLEQPKRDDNMQEGRDHSINASKLAEQKSPWPPQSPVSEGTDFTQKTMRSSLSRMVIRNPGEGANDFGDNPTSRRSSDSPSFSKLRGMSRGLDQTSPAAAPKTPPPPKTPSSSGSDSWWFQQCRRILAMEAGSPWPSVPSPQPSHGTRLMKNEATPLPHHVASSAPSDHEQDHLDDRRLSKSLNQAINGLEALLSEAIQVAEQAADEKDAVGAEVVLREAQSVRDDAFARLHFEPPASTEKGSPVQAETRLAQKHDSNLSGLWTPGRKSSLGAPALSAQLASRRPSAVPPSTTESNTTFPVANSARPRTYTVDTRDPEKGQESSYPLFRPARTRTPYPGNSPVTSRRESHLVDPFSTEDSRDTRSTSSSLSSDFSADVEDNVTVPARRSSRPHQDFVAKPNALSNGLVTPDRRPLMNSDDSSVISSFPKPLRVNEDTRHIDWHAVSDRRPSKVPPGKVLRPGHDRRKSSIARAAWWVPRGTPAGGTTRPSAFRELVDRFSISGRGGFSAAVRASNHDGLAATPIPSEDIALRRLSEVPELGSERTKEPTEIGDVDTDAAPPPQESKFSRSRFSLRDRRHVSFRGHHHRLSFRRLHRPHPIARDWSVTRKRFVASVACINTAFVGLIVGIYAGEVPRIQYQIVDLNGRVILGNVLFYIGLAISTFCAWTLPLLHGRKPYVLGSLAILLPLQLPQALAIGTPRSPYVATYLVAVLLARATSGFILGFAQVNFVTTLLDVFGPSLQSSNPHGDLVSGHGGGGMGIWLSIWSWCFLGSVGTGFFIGGGIISNLNAAWGFQLIIVLGSIILLFNILVPEVRRSPYRRTISEIRSGNGEVSERLARGEVMMDLYSTGPIWWYEEVHAGFILCWRMLGQPGFVVLATYLGWIYGQIVTVIILLSALLSKHYRFKPEYIGLCILAVPIGGLLAIPFQKTSSLFNRSQGSRTLTLEKRIPRLIRRGMFMVLLPLADLGFAMVSTTRKTRGYILPTLFAGIIGFLSTLALAEGFKIIIRVYDISDLHQMNMIEKNKKKRMSISRRRRRRDNTSHPRISAAFTIIQGIGFIFASIFSGVGGIMERRMGGKIALGIVTGVMVLLSLALGGVLWRWKMVEVEIIGSGRVSGDNNRDGDGDEVDGDGDGEYRDGYGGGDKDGNGNGRIRMRKMNILERGQWTRWSEIRKLNGLTT